MARPIVLNKKIVLGVALGARLLNPPAPIPQMNNTPGTATPAGVSVTASVGTAIATGKGKGSPTGQAVTASAGTATVTGKGKTTPTGQATTAGIGTATGAGRASTAPTGQTVTASAGTATEKGKATATPTGQSATAQVGTATADGGAAPAPAPVPIQRWDSAGSVFVLGTERAREIVRRGLPAPDFDPLPHLPDPKKLRISQFQPIKLNPIKVELPPEEPIRYTGTAKPAGIRARSAAGSVVATASTDEEDIAILMAHLAELIG